MSSEGGQREATEAEHGAGGQCQQGEEPCVQTQERDLSGDSEQIKREGESTYI